MRISCIITLLLFCHIVFSQLSPSGLPDYNLRPASQPDFGFIRYDLNRFELVEKNPAYDRLYARFDTLLKKGSKPVSIVHFGGSHIQADIYTHRIRQQMQSMYPGILGSRGFFFPFKIAATNSPSNLKISFAGEWKTSRNTRPDSSLTLGVSGITSALVSDSGSITIVATFDSLYRYDFNRVKIFCNASGLNDIPQLLPGATVRSFILDTVNHFVRYDLMEYEETLSMVVHTTKKGFELYGICLENDDPGVTYSAIGVNGAMLKSYLSCTLFTSQLAILQPDWVILSIGTNEGNTDRFDGAEYRSAYLALLDSVKKAAPGAAIMLTVPNDSYFRKRYINHNTTRMREIIFDIAKAGGYGVWDFYSVMGGLNSAKDWYKAGLMSTDHIHFTKAGYLLKGDLFYCAFLNSWNDAGTGDAQQGTSENSPSGATLW